MRLLSLAVGLFFAASIASGASSAPPSQISLSVPNNGQNLSGTVPVDATASANPNRVEFYLDNVLRFTDTGRPYQWLWNTTTSANGSHTIRADAVYKTRRGTAQLAVTVLNGAPPPPAVCGDGIDNDGDGKIDYPADPGCTSAADTDETDPVSGGQRFDTTLPAGTTGLPRSLSFCMASIVRDPYDPNGNAPYNVPRDDLSTGWSDSRFSWWSGFPKWLTRRAQIDDHYTYADGSAPTTTEIFSVAGCRWGVREDLLRAVAVQESDWHEHGGTFLAWGDRCSGHTNPDDGFGSYGIMQIKNFNCANEGDWGGFPRSWYSTPFNVDLYGAAFRACLEQSFWYTIPAGDSNDRREHGCVGAWFSGSYNPDISYTNQVYGHLANRDWTHY